MLGDFFDFYSCPGWERSRWVNVLTLLARSSTWQVFTRVNVFLCRRRPVFLWSTVARELIEQRLFLDCLLFKACNRWSYSVDANFSVVFFLSSFQELRKKQHIAQVFQDDISPTKCSFIVSCRLNFARLLLIWVTWQRCHCVCKTVIFVFHVSLEIDG